jgi:hypothetical protein
VSDQRDYITRASPETLQTLRRSERRQRQLAIAEASALDLERQGVGVPLSPARDEICQRDFAGELPQERGQAAADERGEVTEGVASHGYDLAQRVRPHRASFLTSWAAKLQPESQKLPWRF